MTCAENEKQEEEVKSGIQMDAHEIGDGRRGSWTGNLITR
jgi:hypothetical protein